MGTKTEKYVTIALSLLILPCNRWALLTVWVLRSSDSQTFEPFCKNLGQSCPAAFRQFMTCSKLYYLTEYSKSTHQDFMGSDYGCTLYLLSTEAVSTNVVYWCVKRVWVETLETDVEWRALSTGKIVEYGFRRPLFVLRGQNSLGLGKKIKLYRASSWERRCVRKSLRGFRFC